MACCEAQDHATVKAGVKQYYGQVLQSSADLKTSACTSDCRPSARVQEAIRRVPEEILAKFYGCGAPLPLGIEGLRVVDLGSGSGRDAYVAAAFVGEQGSVTGVDMTAEQLEVARRHVDAYTRQLGYQRPNLRFVEGQMEDLRAAGLPDACADLVISNCVINLSPDKARALAEAFRVLAPGGEFYFSDVYADRQLSLVARKHEVLWGECLAGALWVDEFFELAQAAGFARPRALSRSPIEVRDAELKAVVGDTNFSSITFRLFKLPQGGPQGAGATWTAQYKGSVGDQVEAYQLDEGTRLPAGEAVSVPADVAALLRDTWLRRHFEVQEGGAGAAASEAAAMPLSCCQPKASCCGSRE